MRSENIHEIAEAVIRGKAIPPAPFDVGDDILIQLATGSIKPSEIEWVNT